MITGSEVSAAVKAAPLLTRLWDLAKETVKGLDEQLKYEFGVAFDKYCEVVIKKYCKARTFFIRGEPRLLSEFYVPCSIDRGDGQPSVPGNLTSLAKVNQATVVTGSGGSGKTIFMRYLISDSIVNCSGVPVFIELRNLNDIDKPSLEGEIVSFMASHGFPLSEKFALKALRSGHLTLILDGFDEVAFSKRKVLEKAIKKLASNSKCQIVLSSRPDMLLEGWDGFSTVRIAPLTLDEACQLVEKLHLDDDELKARFICALRAGLFASHRYFLSNPLLLSIMLITYGDSADIPKRFATFYEQAYTALFQKHDALKSGFKRHRHTDLDIYEFSKLFSAFSAITYDKRKFKFSVADAIAYLDQAHKVSGVRVVDAQGFLDDCRQAVCLLVEDGLDLAFVHRSFQEYFVAKFISESVESLQKSYIEKISSGRVTIDVDNVLRVLYELSPRLVEDYYLIPGLDRFFGDLAKRKLAKSGWRKLFLKALSSVNVTHDGAISYQVESGPVVSLVLFFKNNCSRKVDAGFASDISYDGLVAPGDSLDLNETSARSPVWEKVAQEQTFGIDALESLRLEFLQMKREAEARKDSIEEIFAFDK